MQLQLNQTWDVGLQIDGGGFGRVHQATAGGQEAAVKFVPKEPGADRELLFENLGTVRNVVPIIDSGETTSEWVLVMPRAERSLRTHLTGAAAPLDLAESVRILSDIATALVDLDGRVVHRDLKPENVLLLDGRWCLADFGISRYAEATTAPDTHKFAWTSPYAAPEQWRHERATTATDVYAFGTIAFELFTGARPFTGPDFRQQHLHDPPPVMRAVPPVLAALVEECLYKAPGARPTPTNILARLERFATMPASAAVSKLHEANRAEIVRRSEAARRESEARSEADRRSDLVAAARTSLEQIGETLRETIMAAAPAASLSVGGRGGWSIRLGPAHLELASLTTTPANPWGDWEAPGIDVIAHSSLNLRILPTSINYEGRSHSLWFCDARGKGQYAWYEVAFMLTSLTRGSSRQNPFYLDPGLNAAKALWRGISELQVAWSFNRLTVGDLDEFIERWVGWFADAASGRLQHPHRMPER